MMLLVGVFSLIVSEPGLTSQVCLQQSQPDTPLEFGKTIKRELAGREEHNYIIRLKAGQFIQAVVEQLGIDVVVSIFGQGEKPLAEIDRLNGLQGPETISLIAPSSSDYRLQIRSDRNRSIRGQYQVTLKGPRSAVSSDGKRIDAELATFEATRLWTKNNADSFRHAARKFEWAQSLWSELNEPYEAGISLYGAGLSYRSLGQNQKAIKAYNNALEFMRTAEDRLGMAIVLSGAGWSYFYLGELDQAMESFSQSLRLGQGVRHPAGEGHTYYGLGWVYVLRKDNQLAMENFERSLRLRLATNDRRGEALTRIGLGKIYSMMDRFDESSIMLEQALRTLRDSKDNGGQADTLSHLGWNCIRQKQDAAAERHFQEELELSSASRDLTGEADASFGLAVLARRKNALSEALDHIERVVEIIESFRTEDADSVRTESADLRLRISYFAKVQEYFDFYIDLLMRLDRRETGAGHAASALHANERARARSLLDLLARAGARGAELNFAPPLRVGEIQRELLDEKTVLLEYALGDEGDYLWLVTQTGVEGYRLPRRDEIEAAAMSVYELSTVRNRIRGPERREQVAQADNQFQVAARKLSGMLFEQVATKIRGKRLIIVPHGALQFAPFAALPSPDSGRAGERGSGGAGERGSGRQGDKETRRQGEKDGARSKLLLPHSPALPLPRSPVPPISYRPLIADHEIVVVPSASVLAAIRRRSAARLPAERGLIVFADPVFSPSDDRVRRTARPQARPPQTDGAPSGATSSAGVVVAPGLDRLSTTAWEARRIASFGRGSDRGSRIVKDFAATRSAVIDPSLGAYRFIHFATHALIDQRNPDLSALVLSQVDEQGKSQKGSLTAQDIHHLKLPAELIVLSACRTGLGKDVRGEGLLSLTRGFLSAGASRVMVSLWAVEDQATAEMMSRFYSRMLGPQPMTAAAALRATQEEMWREGRWAPYYWGGFVLQGDWR